MKKNITNFIRPNESGQADGHATFSVMQNSWIHFTEKASFKLNSGLVLSSFREFRLEPSFSGIEIYFLDSKQYSKLFLNLTFSLFENKKGKKTYHSTSEHLCGSDLYEVDFYFQNKLESLYHIIFECKVKGPFKNYISKTILFEQSK